MSPAKNPRNMSRQGRRTGGSEPKGFLQRIEQGLIRTVILSAVLLVLVQMAFGLAKDPVDFYISVAQNVEEPSLDFMSVAGTVTPDKIQENTPENNQQNPGVKTWILKLKATPAAPVRVVQNGRVLGTLTKGELEIPVQAGTLQLDGSQVSQIVRIQVINKDPQLQDPRLNQTLIIEHNVQTLRVGL